MILILSRHTFVDPFLEHDVLLKTLWIAPCG